MHRSSLVALFAVAIIGMSASGCGSAASSQPAASQPAASSPSAAAGVPIAVDLNEWTVVPAQATAPAGSVTFTVANNGQEIHEFVVVKTDTKADAIAVIDNKIDESSLTAVDEIEDIATGTTPTLTVDLAPGHYVLLCNIEAHYGQGMHADFDVN
jgi:uncharacterized cupredoxin-like copper-binding protein